MDLWLCCDGILELETPKKPQAHLAQKLQDESRVPWEAVAVWSWNLQSPLSQVSLCFRFMLLGLQKGDKAGYLFPSAMNQVA